MNKMMFAAAVMMAGTAVGHGAVVDFQNYYKNAFTGDDAYMGMQDTLIVSGDKDYKAGDAENGGTLLGNAWSSYRRPIKKWDLSAMQGQYQSINSAKVKLSFWKGHSNTIEAYKLFAGENYENANWTEADACWNQKNAEGEQWAMTKFTLPNGYKVNSMVTEDDLLGTYEYTATGDVMSWTLDLPADLVQHWIEHPEQNVGLCFRTSDDVTVAYTNLIKMSSGDKNKSYNYVVGGIEDQYFYPTLTIDYEAVPEPASLALFGLGGLVLLRRR